MRTLLLLVSIVILFSFTTKAQTVTPEDAAIEKYSAELTTEMSLIQDSTLANQGSVSHYVLDTAKLDQEASSLGLHVGDQEPRFHQKPQTQTTTSPKTGFRHMVMFKLKPNLDKQALDKLHHELERLRSIPGVNDFTISQFRALGDPRALSDYQVAIDMYFASEAAYRSYQQHPVHLEVKATLKPFLAGPPAVYDRD